MARLIFPDHTILIYRKDIDSLITTSILIDEIEKQGKTYEARLNTLPIITLFDGMMPNNLCIFVDVTINYDWEQYIINNKANGVLFNLYSNTRDAALDYTLYNEIILRYGKGITQSMMHVIYTKFNEDMLLPRFIELLDIYSSNNTQNISYTDSMYAFCFTEIYGQYALEQTQTVYKTYTQSDNMTKVLYDGQIAYYAKSIYSC